MTVRLLCGDDKLVKIYDFQKRNHEKVLKGHNWDVNSGDWHERAVDLWVHGQHDKVMGSKIKQCVKPFCHTEVRSSVRFQKYTQTQTKL